MGFSYNLSFLYRNEEVIMGKKILVYNTHIEISPYHRGECEKLEKSMSVFDRVCHCYVPVAYYIENDTLYLPRGFNLSKLEFFFNEVPSIQNGYDKYNRFETPVEIKGKPKNQIQKDSIDFLLSKGNYGRGKLFTQKSLNLDTGDGKTFCSIYAIAKMGLKTIIITHKKKIREQWKEEFLDKTDIDPDRIYIIDGRRGMDKIMQGKVDADIYLVNHQTLHSYARLSDDENEEESLTYENQNWSRIRDFFKKIRVGIKIIDESHLFFNNTLMIDYFSNTRYTFYITATFNRSDYYEDKIFRQAFSSVYRFGEETLDYEEKRKHINFVIVYFHTRPTTRDKYSMVTRYGFSAYRYIDYELKNNPEHHMITLICNLVKKIEYMEGKILINVPKIEAVDYVANELRKETDKKVGTVYSKNDPELNREGYESDIICSTIKSIGVGDDIGGLRCIINTEPIASASRADQLKGRLREYAPDMDTFIFHLVDTSIEQNLIFLDRIMPLMEKKCKKIIKMVI